MLRIKLCSIFVDDQTKALRFYTDVLGFVKSRGHSGRRVPLDLPSAPPPAARTDLALEPNANPAARTYQQALLAQGIPGNGVRGRRGSQRSTSGCAVGGVEFEAPAVADGARNSRPGSRHLRRSDHALPAVGAPSRRVGSGLANEPSIADDEPRERVPNVDVEAKTAVLDRPRRRRRADRATAAAEYPTRTSVAARATNGRRRKTSAIANMRDKPLAEQVLRAPLFPRAACSRIRACRTLRAHISTPLVTRKTHRHGCCGSRGCSASPPRRRRASRQGSCH